MAYPLAHIAPSNVRIGPRLRGADRDVTELAESMAEVGLIYPIHVMRENGHYNLIAGRHRLKAAQQLNWDAIAAYVFDGDALHAELLQIDENLIRKDLTAADRAKHLARRKELYEAIHPETKHGGTGRGRNRDADSATLSFAADTAAKTGTPARTIAKSVQIGTNIAPDVMDAVADSELADEKTALLELSRLDHDEQREVVGSMERARQAVRDQADTKKKQREVAKKIKAEIKAKQPKRRQSAESGPSPLTRALRAFDRWWDQWGHLAELGPIMTARRKIGN